MNKTVVIDIVGLSDSVIGDHTPFLKQFKKQHHFARIQPPFPALTTSSQSTYVTGQSPAQHGIVGNGWYDRIEAEVKFWKQSDKLVAAPKIWENARTKNPEFTCSKMFWWYNMYSEVDFSATPRPQYRADGVKMPDCYTHPGTLRDELQEKLGVFPLFSFWGPGANIKSSKWIAEASILVDQKNDPTLTLIYLPHLDYALQKYGHLDPRSAQSLREIDNLVEKLVTHYEKQDSRVILLSEYGINPVDHPIHLNRVFREKGWIAIREENGKELLDAGASKAFVVADHQIAHVYINDPQVYSEVAEVLESTPGIRRVLDHQGKIEYGINHERAGDLVLIAEDNSWFTYYYWNDDDRAADFARTVQIHKKPGYDPAEMFFDQSNPMIKARAAYKIIRKKLGLRYILDVISLDANLVKGSHGSPLVPERFHPICLANTPLPASVLEPEKIYDLMWTNIFGD